MKTKLLIGALPIVGVFSWLGINPDPTSSELQVVPCSLSAHSECQSEGGGEISKSVGSRNESGPAAAQSFSSADALMEARPVFSMSRENKSHAARLTQEHKNILNRERKETHVGQFSHEVEDETNVDTQSSVLHSLKSKPQISNSSKVMATHGPAAWVQLPDSPHLTLRQQEEIQAMAEALLTTMRDAEPEIKSPEEKIAMVNDAILYSDAEFRRKFGQRAWMDHHIQAYHLGLAR